MTPERKVKNAVANILKKSGAYYFYPVTGGYGSSGVPDIIGCYRGCFFAVECKAGSGRTTALQEKNLEEIRRNGGIAIVVNEENLPQVQEFLDNLSKKGV
jgi:Holliday junction resolvase